MQVQLTTKMRGLLDSIAVACEEIKEQGWVDSDSLVWDERQDAATLLESTLRVLDENIWDLVED